MHTVSSTKFNLQVKESPIHNRGLFTEQFIPARRHVIEYTGTRLNRKAYKQLYSDGLSFHERPYLFGVNSYWTIDGAVGGSGAQFTNHSCSPNMRAIVRNQRVFFVALRDINPGEELTIDYYLESSEKIPCVCGTPECRGELNG